MDDSKHENSSHAKFLHVLDMKIATIFQGLIDFTSSVLHLCPSSPNFEVFTPPGAIWFIHASTPLRSCHNVRSLKISGSESSTAPGLRLPWRISPRSCPESPTSWIGTSSSYPYLSELDVEMHKITLSHYIMLQFLWHSFEEIMLKNWSPQAAAFLSLFSYFFMADKPFFFTSSKKS